MRDIYYSIKDIKFSIINETGIVNEILNIESSNISALIGIEEIRGEIDRLGMSSYLLEL